MPVLGLTRPDILGWSMGSMIALAVLHPGQVRRLVLARVTRATARRYGPPRQRSTRSTAATHKT